MADLGFLVLTDPNNNVDLISKRHLSRIIRYVLYTIEVIKEYHTSTEYLSLNIGGLANRLYRKPIDLFNNLSSITPK